MMFYPDSSFLVSLYLSDSNTEATNAFLAKAHAPLAFTSFNRVELRNALRNMVARREATSAAVAKAFSLMEGDLNDSLLVEKKLDLSKLLKAAEQLSSRYGEKHVIRCVDLLHVASAHVLETGVFLTFDRQQATFARQTGLIVKP
jgi:predicted nucleic acid-binding protein